MTDVLTEANKIIDEVVEKATVTITKEEHDMFVIGAKILAALKAAGVEKWEGFEAALGAAFE